MLCNRCLTYFITIILAGKLWVMCWVIRFHRSHVQPSLVLIAATKTDRLLWAMGRWWQRAFHHTEGGEMGTPYLMNAWILCIFMKFYNLFRDAILVQGLLSLPMFLPSSSQISFFLVDLTSRNCYNLHREQAESFAQVGTSKCSTIRASQVQTDLWPISNSEIPQMQSLSTPKGNNKPLLNHRIKLVSLYLRQINRKKFFVLIQNTNCFCYRWIMDRDRLLQVLVRLSYCNVQKAPCKLSSLPPFTGSLKL